MKQFLVDSKKELGKIQWPDKPKVVETTMIVAGCTAVFAAYLWAMDLGISQLFATIFYR